MSQATPKLWMAPRQVQPPAPSCHPHPEEQWKQAEALAAAWDRGLDGQLAPWNSMPDSPSSWGWGSFTFQPWEDDLLTQAETDNLLLPDTCAAPDGHMLLSDYIKWSSSYIPAIGKEVWLNCNGFSAWEHIGSPSATAQLIYCHFQTEKIFKNVIPSFASQTKFTSSA